MHRIIENCDNIDNKRIVMQDLKLLVAEVKYHEKKIFKERVINLLTN